MSTEDRVSISWSPDGRTLLTLKVDGLLDNERDQLIVYNVEALLQQ